MLITRFEVSYFDKKEKQQNKKDRDDRPSWREKDAKNEKRSYANVDPTHSPSSLDKRKEQLAKQALNDLFVKKKPKEQIEALRNLTLLKGSALQAEIKSYVEKYGVGKDYDDLLVLIDTQDFSIFKEVISNIEQGLENETPSKKSLCSSKLRIVKLSHDDPDFVDLIEKTLSLLEV